MVRGDLLLLMPPRPCTEYGIEWVPIDSEPSKLQCPDLGLMHEFPGTPPHPLRSQSLSQPLLAS